MPFGLTVEGDHKDCCALGMIHVRVFPNDAIENAVVNDIFQHKESLLLLLYRLVQVHFLDRAITFKANRRVGLPTAREGEWRFALMIKPCEPVAVPSTSGANAINPRGLGTTLRQ